MSAFSSLYKSLVKFLVAPWVIFLVSPVFAVQTWKSYPRGAWDLELHTSYYQATANYVSDGNYFQSLPAGLSYRLISFEPGFRYHFHKWAIFSDFQINSAESKSLTETRTNSGLAQARLGTDFVLYSGSFALVPELSVVYPFTKYSEDDDVVAMNEGALEGSARLIALAHFWKIRWAPYFGFTYRDGGRSSLLPLGLLTEFQFRHFVLGNEIKSFQSISYDKATNNDQARRNWFNRANGGSSHFYSVNPRLLENTTWLRFVVDNSLWLQAGASFTLNGSNAGAGWTGFVGLLYRNRPEKRISSSDVKSFRVEESPEDEIPIVDPNSYDPMQPQVPMQNRPRPRKL